MLITRVVLYKQQKIIFNFKGLDFDAFKLLFFRVVFMFSHQNKE